MVATDKILGVIILSLGFCSFVGAQTNPGDGNSSTGGGSIAELKQSIPNVLLVREAMSLVDEVKQDFDWPNYPIYLFTSSTEYDEFEKMSVRVKFVNTPLFEGGDEVDAKSNRHTKEIAINIVRWINQENRTEKKGLLFHELLVLLGRERTGVYTWSSYYKATIEGVTQERKEREARTIGNLHDFFDEKTFSPPASTNHCGIKFHVPANPEKKYSGSEVVIFAENVPNERVRGHRCNRADVREYTCIFSLEGKYCSFFPPDDSEIKGLCTLTILNDTSFIHMCRNFSEDSTTAYVYETYQ